jgi:hypothetical protein
MSNKISVEELVARYSDGERDFSGADLSMTRLVNCDFSDAVFENTNFTNATFLKCSFNRACFNNSNLTRINIESVNFQSCQLEKAILVGCQCQFVNFNYANLRYAKFMGSNIRESSFEDTELSYADFSFVYNLDSGLYEEGIYYKTIMPDLSVWDEISTPQWSEIDDDPDLNEIILRANNHESSSQVSLFDEIYATFIEDKEMCKHLMDVWPPYSFRHIVCTLLKLNHLTYWSTSEENIDNLKKLYHKADELIESDGY